VLVLLLAAEPAARSWSEPTFAAVTIPSDMADTVWDIEIDPHPVAPQGPVLRGRLRIGRTTATSRPSLTRDSLSAVFPAFITLESDPAVEQALERVRRLEYLERLHLARAEGKPDPEWEPMPPGTGVPFSTGQQMIEITASISWLPPFVRHPRGFALVALPARTGSYQDSVFLGEMSPGMFEGTFNRQGACFPSTTRPSGRPFRMRRIA
jgi:hypothetical protein